MKSLLLSASALFPTMALALDNNALPNGGAVVSGSANLTYDSNKLNIHQNSERTIINWNSFNIGKNATTEFFQPNSQAIAVNRVVGDGQDPTQILGSLKANGTVMVLDRNGVLFGQNSVIDVGGIIVSTGDINNEQFMSGANIIELNGVNTSGSIVNDGTITVSEGGLASFVAPHIVNNGVINAKMGRVSFAAGTRATLDLYGDGLVEIAVDDDMNDAIVEHNGAINAEGGSVLITVPTAKNIVDNVINMDGLINVSSVTQKGGKIVLGGGNIKVSGALEANGKTGGGTIHVGGEYQGGGSKKNALNTIVTSNATLKANAFEKGDGGEVIVWADNATGYAGFIEATGGAEGGDGGFVEVSGKSYLDFRGEVDLSGDKLGTVLLDPDDIDIVAGVANPGEFADDLIAFAENTPGTSILGADTLNTRLSANANVTLQANNTIDVDAAVSSTGSGNLTLETGTGGTITVNQSIDVNTGDLLIRSDNIDINADISGSGDVTLRNYTRHRTMGIGTGATGSNLIDDTELNHIQDGFNSITLDSYDGDMDIETYTWNDSVVFESLAGDINVDGAQNFDTNDATFYGRGTLDFNASVTGAGNLIFRTKGSSSIGVGDDASGNFTINDSDLAQITDGFSEIQSIANNGAISYDTNGAYTFQDDVSFSSSGNSISITDLAANRSVVVSADDIVMTTTTINNSSGADTSFTLQAKESITLTNSTILATVGAIDVTLHADTNNNNAGYIYIDNTDITTNGGDFVAGGGLNPLLDYAWGTATLDDGVTIEGGSVITTGAGNISIMGHGRNDAVTSLLSGITISQGSNLISTTGDITLDGVAGNGDINNFGIYVTGSGTTITSTDGDILLTGQGGSAGIGDSRNNYGLYIIGSALRSTGTGVNASTITLDGTGAHAGTRRNHGIYIGQNNTEVTSIDGDITITGRGGDGSTNENYGVYVLANADISSTGAGSNAADITINGTGGDGTNSNYGFYATGTGTTITTVDGDVSIVAQGGDGTSTVNYGAYMASDASISSTGTGVDAGTITLDGTGGNGTDENYGVFLEDVGTLITSVEGAIDITGQGGDGTGTANFGVYVANDADVISTGVGTGAATITIDGTAGNGGINGTGVVINDANTIISSTDGDISITGQGGTNNIGDSRNNHGVSIASAEIISSGTGGNAAKITINGTGADANRRNYGVSLKFAASINSVDGEIDVTGRGGDSNVEENYGIYMESASDITSTGTNAGAATITLNGTGGNGTDDNYGVYVTGAGTTITSVDGAIDVIGQGGSDGTLGNDGNYGLFLEANADITSTGVGANAATITLDGTGGNGTNTNHGVYLQDGSTNISSIDGDILVTALGGSDGSTGDSNRGLYIDGADIVSTGVGSDAANITLNVTGGAGGRGNLGFYGRGSYITVVDGDILITGLGGADGTDQSNVGIQATNNSTFSSTGTGSGAGTITLNGTGALGAQYNHGINLTSNSQITSIDGDINLIGQGGNVPGQNNMGVTLSNGVDIISTGTGVDAAKITISGTSGSGSRFNYGVRAEDAGTTITSIDGDISITGNSAGTTYDNFGVYFRDGMSVSSTGVGVNAAEIIINGAGGTGTTGNHGVYLEAAGTIMTAVDGAIDVTGVGGNGTDNNYGIFVNSDALVESTGIGADASTITFNGTGNGVNSAYGLSVEGDSNILSVDGNVSLTGLSNGTNDNNAGVHVRGSSTKIESSGAGTNAANIIILGTGGVGDDNNDGIDMAGGLITAVDGNIDLTGIGRSNGGAGSINNSGISLSNGFDVTSTGVGAGAGTITLNGIGGSGVETNYGVHLTDAGTTVSSVDGTIDITAQGQGSGVNNDDLHVDNAAITTTNSDIDLSADTYVLSNAASISSGNNLNITARTNGTSIGLGAGVGTLNLDNTELNLLSATGSVRIGEVSSPSTINIDNVNTVGAGYDVEIIGGQITVDNGLAGGGTVFLQSTQNDITLNSGVVAGSGAGNTLVFASANDLVNNAGVAVLDPDTGRYIIYMKDYKTFVPNGLTGTNIYNRTYASYPPASVSGTANSFIFENSLPVSDDVLLPENNTPNYVAQFVEKNAELSADEAVDDVIVWDNASQNEAYGSISCLVSYSDTGGCAIH